MKLWDLLLLLTLAAPNVFAAPFLSSSPYPDTGLQPTEFLVTIDATPEVTSAASNLQHMYTMEITGFSSATTYKVTIGGFDVSVVGNTDTVTTASLLTAAMNNSVNSNFTPITWSFLGAVITGKHDSRGISFTPTTSVTGGTGTFGAPVEKAEPDEACLLFDLAALQFGTHTASVKAKNASLTSTATVIQFQVGVQMPNLILIPSAP
ncbi:MAG: hypothetical protein ACREX4_20190 [Gammaproteobacteria bacterium]